MSTSPQSPPKRPRLSLQIRALANGPSVRTSRCLAAAVDVKSPTSFNTLSNVYATAVDRSTPVQENPPTAILGRRPMLRLQTNEVAVKPTANTPYLGPYLDTPITAQAMSPAVARQVFFPSAMTATPPLSAQPPEQNGAQVFTFDGTTPATALPPGLRAPAPAAQNPKRRTTMPIGGAKLPYTHPRSLRSILRNSPLPPLSTMSPESPRRQSRRLQEKAARRVAYNSPLTQDITTSRYIKSHIDLLAEDATPISPSTSSSDDGDCLLDQAMADADNTRDGGQTPGPFEEMRRRMANMHASTPVALSPTGGGIRKRGGKRREKKRRWVWTIGRGEDGEDGDEGAAVEPEPAAAAAKQPTPPSVPVLAVPAPRPRTRNQQAQLAKAVAAATQTQMQTLETKVPLLAVPVPPARAATTPTVVPTLNAAAPPPLAPTAPQQPQPRAITQQQQSQQTRELTPIPASLLPTRHSTPDSTSSCANSVRHLTPEPLGMGMGMSFPMSLAGPSPGGEEGGVGVGGVVERIVIEPPTPSMESTTSVGSSLHSGREDEADVEMSDASSFTSVEDDRDGGCGDDEDVAVGGKVAGGYGLRCGFGLGLLIGNGEGGSGDGDVEMDEGTPTMTARPVGERGGRGWVPWRDVVS